MFIGFGCRKWATSSQRGDGDSASRYTKDVVAFCESRATLDLPGDLMVAPFMSYADQRAEKCTRNFRLGTGRKEKKKVKPTDGEYKGEVDADGKPHGQGAKTYVDGRKYVGGWEHGQPHGQGTLTYAGGRYVGGWKHGRHHGLGTLIDAYGEYKGDWYKGYEHGQGTLTYTGGNRYVGGWKHGKHHGQGTLTYASGRKYVGGWEHGEPHGEGTTSGNADDDNLDALIEKL